MGYNDLSECTLTADERASEAVRIGRILFEEHARDNMTDAEQKFTDRMFECSYCSVKQLFWLRDIKDKYI